MTYWIFLTLLNSGTVNPMDYQGDKNSALPWLVPLPENLNYYYLMNPFRPWIPKCEAFRSEFRHRKPNGLSGGQKQRVALARALARKPQLLLLDEPLSALDTQMRSALQDEIAKAHDYNGTTTILVSHDISEVFRLAHKVLKLSHGKVDA